MVHATSLADTSTILNPRRCKNSLVGESTGLLVPSSPARFRQKLQQIENSNLHLST